MKKLKYKSTSKVILKGDDNALYFGIVSKEASDEIKENFGGDKKSFNPIPVDASIRTTTWATALVPDGASGGYLLPIKTKVREKEEIEEGIEISFTIQVKELPVKKVATEVGK